MTFRLYEYIEERQSGQAQSYHIQNSDIENVSICCNMLAWPHFPCSIFLKNQAVLIFEEKKTLLGEKVGQEKTYYI